MLFLVRKMRAHARLRRFKVIVVTDRKDLQTQRLAIPDEAPFASSFANVWPPWSAAVSEQA